MMWPVVKRQLKDPEFGDGLVELGRKLQNGPVNSEVWGLQIAYIGDRKKTTGKKYEIYEQISESLAKIHRFVWNFDKFAR